MTREWVDSGDKLPPFFKEEMSHPFPLLGVKKWVIAREFARQFEVGTRRRRVGTRTREVGTRRSGKKRKIV